MPNLLAHFGVQALATRALLPHADLRWILLGVLLPDLPWILVRIVRAAPLPVDPIDLRLYGAAQASLAFCLLLATGLALLTRRPRRVLAILALGALLHLILDATQTKWGNGVQLLAPWSWKLWNLGLYWPESVVTLLITLFGVAWLAWAWRRAPGRPIELQRRPGRLRTGAALVLFGAYWALPTALIDDLEASNSHHSQTLRAVEARPGEPVEFDRVLFERTRDGATVHAWNGERLEVSSGGPARSGVVSVRGRFADAGTLEIHEFHVHAGRLRDLASYVGLVLVAGVWMWLPMRQQPSHRGGA